tara:strand:- start:67 stop:630 length:564 start_codon:yes stop_codon:yes gene_type:complete
MANIDAPFGLNPVEKIGSGPSGKMMNYRIASGETNSIFQGDAVMPDSGFIQQATNNADLLGVFWGCKYDDPTTNKPTFKNQYASVATNADAFVYDDPYQVFEIQGDSGTASLDTQVMQSADLANTTALAGSTTTGVSKMELDSSDLGAPMQQMIVQGFSGNPERNQIDADGHAVYKVLISEHVYSNL